MSTPKILSLIFLLFPLWYFLFNFPFLHLAPNFPEGREMGTTRTNLGTSLIITYPEKNRLEKPLSFVFSPKIGTLQLFFSFVFLVPSSKDPTWWSRSRGGGEGSH